VPRTGSVQHWRLGGGGYWPPLVNHAEHWPAISAEIWSPPAGRGITVCLSSPLQIIRWDTAGEAASAAGELFDRRCSDQCPGRHLLVVTDDTGVHVAVIGPPAPPPTLAAELQQAGYHRAAEAIEGRGRQRECYLPETWPTPTRFNNDLRRYTDGPRRTETTTGQAHR
jgi:hypothetical protein